METLLSEVPEWLRHPALLALIVAAVSVAMAKLVELFLCGALGRLARRTRTDFDDKLIDALHRPIFVSVLLLGVRMAVLILGPPEAVLSWTDSIVQTLAIFVWTVAGLRVISLVCGNMDGAVRRSEWIDERTLPLFDNLARLILPGRSSLLPAPGLESEHLRLARLGRHRRPRARAGGAGHAVQHLWGTVDHRRRTLQGRGLGQSRRRRAGACDQNRTAQHADDDP